MWLRVPETIDQVVWEGALQPDEWQPVFRDGSREPPATGDRHDVRDLPIVSIGRPDVWPLTALVEAHDLPAPLRAMLSEVSFYLVRLSCSFRPTHERTRIEWARFAVTLWPDEAGRVATAFDLHPLLVTQEVKRNLKVSLSPSLKFHEVEAGLGELGVGLEYPEIQPTISASGAGESEPCWDFSPTAGERVQGSKWMHLLVKAQPAMAACDASLGLTADVIRSSIRIPLLSSPKQALADPLSLRLWG
jgi:hypothetical protein